MGNRKKMIPDYEFLNSLSNVHYLLQVCDDQWHHYSVQGNLPDVRLFVDGHEFHPEGNDASEVIDDWPLHQAKGIDTTLTVGGCWQGADGSIKHGLVGSLSGLSVLIGSHESPEVLGCLSRCQEALETPAIDLLQPSMELLTNNEMTQITVEGDNATNVQTLMRYSSKKMSTYKILSLVSRPS